MSIVVEIIPPPVPLLDVITPAGAVVEIAPAAAPVIVETVSAGPVGPAGPPGPSGTGGGGAGAQQVFVQPNQPTAADPYLWIQTGLAPAGSGFTFWFEDGQ